jgi:tetratricopeptide (TPR) repeat protein
MDNILPVQIDWSGSSELSLYDLRHDEAIRCHNRAIEINPYYRTAFCNKACSKVKEGNIYDALADQQQAIRMNRKIYKNTAL